MNNARLMERARYLKQATAHRIDRDAACALLKRFSVMGDGQESDAKPFQRLFFKVIHQAIQDIGVQFNAIAYFYSRGFEVHAGAIGLNPEWFLKMLEDIELLPGREKVNYYLSKNPIVDEEGDDEPEDDRAEFWRGVRARCRAATV